jgi:flagellar hook assembly protein FlgD
VDSAAKLLWVSVRNPRPSQARIRLFDMNGSVLAVLYDGPLERGDHSFSWDGKAMVPGSYRLELSCDGVVQTRMLKVKMN